MTRDTHHKGERQLGDVSSPMRLFDRLCDRMLGSAVGEHVNVHRRRVLTSLVLGGGAIVASKAAGSALDLISGDAVVNEHLFENFIVRETGKVLSFIDRKTGEAILMIDK